MKKRSSSLYDLTYSDLKANPPKVVILPWGATEAHNQHLPYGSDVIQAYEVAVESAAMANGSGAESVVLPPVPFGNNAQQLDQFVTIHLSTKTAIVLLEDVVKSLTAQGIGKLILVNSHGGNEFKPIIRDLQNQYRVLIVLIDLYKMIPDLISEIFDVPGDHAGELETSLMMYLSSGKFSTNKAGDGGRIPFAIDSLNKSGIWTPRPWTKSHPDLGSGNPAAATAEKGEKYFNALCSELSKVITDISDAEKGEIPYL
ncbi:MAG: creatininase family protein [Melioribacteraceae bacterium]|nr:creatininase family protein [Melioribacteraceae bacterium]